MTVHDRTRLTDKLNSLKKEIGTALCVRFLFYSMYVWIVLLRKFAGDYSSVDFRNIYVKNIRIIGSTLRCKTPQQKGALLQKLVENVWEKLENRQLMVKIYKTFSLQDADAAQQTLYRGENVGKVVLIVNKNAQTIAI